jgi:hypothetical protein
VPQGFTDRHSLEEVFPDFALHEWADADAALLESDQHSLFWRTEPDLPSSLLVLDTPDIDSDARVNWIRADAIRRSADVLIAVLTQQKYNDAAVKEFFRKVAAEDKAVLVVFNQCLLPDDEQYWPIWLKTFTEETGVQPDAVFVAPNDRAAAEAGRLAFYERPWPLPVNWSAAEPRAPWTNPRNLSDDLAKIRFREVRLRTLSGSLRQLLDHQRGVRSHLAKMQVASKELAAASERLSSDAALRIRDWPTPANGLFVAEIRAWWKARQHGWAKRINSVYDAVGTGIKWPIKAARNMIQGEPIPPMDRYRDREWSAILTTVEELFDKLQWMADSGNRLVKPRIEAVLQASTRAELIETLRRRHATIDFDQQLKEVVADQMQTLSQDSPELFKFYRQLNNVSAAVRPMTSVVLFSLGFGPAGETVAPLIADAATQAVVHVVADVAGGATVAVAGERAVSSAAGTGAGMLQTWFHRLNSEFTQRRVEWLTKVLRDELLGTLPEELQAAAAVTDTSEYQHVESLIAELEKLSDSLSGHAVVESSDPDGQKGDAE